MCRPSRSVLGAGMPRPIRRAFGGHLHGDHINAYTKRTLEFIVERAGFKTVSCTPGLFGAASILNHIPGISAWFDGCVYVGEKIPTGSTPKVVRGKSYQKSNKIPPTGGILLLTNRSYDQYKDEHRSHHRYKAKKKFVEGLVKHNLESSFWCYVIL